MEIAGVSYTPEKVKDMAGALLNERKTLSSRLDSLNQAKVSLGKTVSVLQQKQDDYKAVLGKLENQVSEIDAKMVAAKAMQEASASIGESEASLATNVSNLEGKVRELLADVTSTVLSENEKWDEAKATKVIDGIELRPQRSRALPPRLLRSTRSRRRNDWTVSSWSVTPCQTSRRRTLTLIAPRWRDRHLLFPIHSMGQVGISRSEGRAKDR